MTDINATALDVAFAAGVLPRSDTPQEKEIRLVPGGFCEIAERGWGGEKAVKGTIGQKVLGWNPKRSERDWEQDFEDELSAYMEGRRGITINSCVAAP
jgi:hypothetical protein